MIVTAYSGAARYADGFPGRPDRKPRIYVEFRPQGVDGSFLALLDTGGHYCIPSQDVIGLVERQLVDALGEDELQTAYGLLRGDLYVLPIELLAQEGNHLELDVVAFVAPDWHGPTFFGYTGVLDRLNFAVAPDANRFYFAPFTTNVS